MNIIYFEFLISFSLVCRDQILLFVINHHHHQGVPTARIPLILSSYQFLSAISQDNSSRGHQEFAQSWWINFCGSVNAFVTMCGISLENMAYNFVVSSEAVPSFSSCVFLKRFVKWNINDHKTVVLLGAAYKIFSKTFFCRSHLDFYPAVSL